MLPRPYFYRSRRPGRPCWTFSVGGRRFFAWPEHDIAEDDAQAADRWFLAKLAETAPEVHEAVLANRAAKASSPDRPVRIKIAVAPEEEDDMRELVALARTTRSGALTAAIKREHARASRELRPPPSPPRLRKADSIAMRLRVTPAVARDLDDLAHRYGDAWGLPHPNASMVARVAIRRTLQCWPKRVKRDARPALA